MLIKCKDIVNYIEGFAPVHLAEEWDNVGLLVGSLEQEVRRIMVCLDVTMDVVEEAVGKKVDLIISHHPLIFKGMKRINEHDTKGAIIYKLIKNNICVYSAHTNLDVADGGVNEQLASLLGLTDIKNLNRYKEEKVYKVVVYIPEESVDKVREAMNSAGAGWIGNYSDCSFMTKGVGTFRPLEGTNPYIGSKGNLEKVDEYKLETIVPQKALKSVISAMLKAHPYEEVAYDVFTLELEGKQYGLGKVGVLENSLSLNDFITLVKSSLNTSSLKMVGSIDKEIKKVAVFCGSFDGNMSGILKEKADILVTGDIKHHTALDIMELGMCVLDAGHFNTERIIIPKLIEILSKRFSCIEITGSVMEIDPIKVT